MCLREGGRERERDRERVSEGVTERVSERQNEPNFVPSAVFISCLKKIYSTRLDDFNFFSDSEFYASEPKKNCCPY